MYKIILERKAEKSFSQLDQVKRKKVINAIDDLESKGLDSSSVKKLSSDGANIYRKRVGRLRILFTVKFEKNVITIWIIALEKDTQKDYKTWISYILNKKK